MTMEQLMILCLWSSVGLLVYVFVGYPLIMMLFARATKEPPVPNLETWPMVAAVVVMGDEAESVKQKINDLRDNGYPDGRLEIIVVLDAPTDDTATVLESLDQNRLTVVRKTERCGKSAGLNDGVAIADGELIFFCDARQRLRPDAIKILARHFADSTVGAVSGELIIEGGEMGAYWKFEKALRKAESQHGSVIGCTGAIYMVRKTLYKPIPDDTILDDVVIPMQCLVEGYSVKFEPDAVAIDPQPAAMEFETKRKIRTLAGNWQMLARHSSWLVPWSNRAAFQLVSHKYLRLAGPWLLIIAFASNLMLQDSLHRVILGVQSVIYGAAGIGLAFPTLRVLPVRLAATFVYLNWLNAASLPAWAFGLYRRGWQK